MNARQFDLVSNEIERIDSEKFNALSPLVVNSALTCEVYFKALSFITRGTLPKGHDLLELYQGQNYEVQKAIYYRYETLFLSREVSHKYSGPMDEEVFVETLREFKDVFKDWRYVYELPDASIRPYTLSMLRRALRSVTSDYYDGLFY